MKKLEWNVIYHNVNRKKIETYNVFDHGGFLTDVKKQVKKDQTKEEFAEILNRSLHYYFWAKSEREVAITPLHTIDEEYALKVDVYWQIKNNWDLFVDYVWSALKK